MLDAPRTVTSLDKPITAGEGTGTFGELIPGTEPGPEDEIDIALERRRRAAARSGASRRRSATSCGFASGSTARTDPHTLDQVVERLGISRNRVRRLEAEGLARLALLREVQGLRRFG